jgi:hypothetical protein
MRITEDIAKKSEPGSRLWDDDVRGFSLWTSPKGKRTWYAQRSIRNQTHRQKIGEWPDMSVQDARKRAREIIATWHGDLEHISTEQLLLELLKRVRASE